MFDDAGDRANDEEDVTNQCDRDRYADSLVATPPRVGDVRAEQWNDVDPELLRSVYEAPRQAGSLPEGVECTETGGRLLSQPECTRLAVSAG